MSRKDRRSEKARPGVLVTGASSGIGEAIAREASGRVVFVGGALPDEVVRAFVPAATYDEIADVLAGLYDGVADRILFPVPDDPANDDAARRAIAALRAR